ncbi:hypothetical protein SK128_001150, partial [Halocaridina rubra]
DKYEPMFPIREDAVVISSNHKGVVYTAHAEDSDLGLTCPLGPGETSRCPCATIYYHLRQDGNEDANYFMIEELTGEVFLQKDAVLQPGQEFEFTIIAASVDRSQYGHISAKEDVLSLTVVVHHPDSLPGLLQASK